MSAPDDVIEAMKAAIREKMGPVIVHPEASEEVIARQKARQERAADTFVRAALRAAEEAGYTLERGWQSIETAPKDGTHILVFPGLLAYPLVASWERPARTPPMMKARYGDTETHFGFWRVAMSQARVPYEPTHWRPLAAAPKLEEQG